MKGLKRVGDVLDLQRAWKLGFDAPPVFRQQGFYTAGHPVKSAKALAETAPAFASKLGAFKVAEELQGRDNAKNGWYKRHMKLDVSETSGHDEFVQSSLAQKVPVLSNFERWHSAYGARARADLFDTMTAGLSKRGKATEAEAAIIGHAVNAFSGRGNLGQMEQAVGILNKIFLAPKWVVSRYQTAFGEPLLYGLRKHGLQPRARLAVAKEYVRSCAGVLRSTAWSDWQSQREFKACRLTWIKHRLILERFV